MTADDWRPRALSRIDSFTAYDDAPSSRAIAEASAVIQASTEKPTRIVLNAERGISIWYGARCVEVQADP